MKPGEIVRWVNFPFQSHGPAKPRWLICVGKIRVYGQETTVYVCTTTTQLHFYEPGGKRENQPVFHIDPKKVQSFDANCLVDFGMNPLIDLKESLFSKCVEDIEPKGEMPKHEMIQLFNGLVRSGSVPKRTLSLLRGSLQEAGFKGLAKP